MIKVLYCILDNRFGGPHRTSYGIALKLRELNTETIFLTGRKTNERWQPDGVTVFQLKHLQCLQRRGTILNFVRCLFWLPWSVLRIYRIIRSKGISIVHIDGVTNFVPALAAVLARRPVVWTYNDHLPGSLRRILLPFVRRVARIVVVQGQELKKLRTGHDIKLCAKTRVLYSSVDGQAFDPSKYSPQDRDRIKQRLGLRQGDIVVGTVGNLNRFKGHTYFIQAAGRIKKTIESVQFLIVGRRLDTDPDYWEQLKKLTVENGLENDIIFAGFQDDVSAMMAVMDVFVLSSVLESCPVVLLEAMAMRVPVVATDVGAVQEQVVQGRTGRIVPVGDPVAIAEAVLAYMADPEEAQKMAAEAQHRGEAMFGIDTIAQQHQRLYEEIAGRQSE